MASQNFVLALLELMSLLQQTYFGIIYASFYKEINKLIVFYWEKCWFKEN